MPQPRPLCQTGWMLLGLAAAALYLASAAWLARRFAHGETNHAGLALLPAFAAAALHAAAHALGTLAAGALELHFFAALSLVGLGVAALTAALALARPIGALGVVVFPLGAALLVLYRIGMTARGAAPLDWQIELHAGLALLAYAALSVAALLAIMLWLQERALRRRQLASLLRAFPPLTMLEALLFRLIGAGFALLTLALLTGVVFVDDLFAQHLVHKTVLSLLAWAVFGALLLGRLRYGWRGRRAVRLTLVAMTLLGLAFFGSKYVLEMLLMRA
jgi:ABC-type uncharacterized transport system permease subunit